LSIDISCWCRLPVIMAVNQQPPPDVGTNPARLYQHLRSVYDAVQTLQSSLDTLHERVNNPPATPLTAAQLRQANAALSAGGAAPLPLTGLVGTAASPQRPAPVVANDLADLNKRFPASSFPLDVFAIATTTHLLYYIATDAHGVHTWTAV
jgi:hypothetical protein